MPIEINSFINENEFLSNFYNIPSGIIDNYNIKYPTVEHFYQASKTNDKEIRLKISKLKYPGQSKKFGKTFKLRNEWESIKVDIMYIGLIQKFSDKNPELLQKLLNTGNAHLQEGNTWNDTFWGVCKGKGKNMLGKLLMKIREERKREII